MCACGQCSDVAGWGSWEMYFVFLNEEVTRKEKLVLFKFEPQKSHFSSMSHNWIEVDYNRIEDPY